MDRERHNLQKQFLEGNEALETPLIFPTCKTLRINYSQPPDRIFLNFKNNPIIDVTVLIEDRMKALRRRLSKSNSLDYFGPPIKTRRLSPRSDRFILSFAQTIDLEEDTGSMCTKYPTKTFTSFHECDEGFVYNEMRQKYNLMPFWAAKSLNEVTKLKYLPAGKTLPWRYLLEGAQESNCLRPCKSTKVKTIFIRIECEQFSIFDRFMEPFGPASRRKLTKLLKST